MIDPDICCTEGVEEGDPLRQACISNVFFIDSKEVYCVETL